jgi:aryl-alcohol dehydrogenase-like predicted oxidoreductase
VRVARPVSAGTEVELRRLGPTGHRLLRVALGCGNFGGVGSAPAFFGEGLDESQSFELMDAAWAMGITHFDTADAYGGGRSERAIGRWIASRGLHPTITTKTYNPMTDGGDRGLAPKRIARQLESSLDRLGVDRVELYLAHEFDRDVPLADTFAAFEAHQAAGTIGAYGVSNFDAGQLAEAIETGRPAAVQNARSVLEHGGEDVLALCAQHGVAFLAYGPLSGGWLAGKYRRGRPFPPGSRMSQRPEPYARLVNDKTFDALDVIEAYARERGRSLAGLALAWLLADERVGQLVVGPAQPEHLEPVREALARPLAPGEREEVEALC